MSRKSRTYTTGDLRELAVAEHQRTLRGSRQSQQQCDLVYTGTVLNEFAAALEELARLKVENESLAAQLAVANASAERVKAAWDASHNQAMKNGAAALLAKDQLAELWKDVALYKQQLAAREAEIAELRDGRKP